MNFKQFLTESNFFLTEGGNAINGVRINQENVEATLKSIAKNFLPKLKIKLDDTRNLGSTGKKKAGGSSGDIDLAIDMTKIMDKNNINDPKEFFDFLLKVSKAYSDDVADLRSLGLISLAFPIENVDGKQPNSVVQLDLMPTDNIKWSEWAFYSPAEWESKWKGGTRNEILYQVARSIDFKVLKRELDKEGIEVDAEWERYYFDLSKGIMKGIQSRIGKKGLVKNPKTLKKWSITNNPEDAVLLLFGPKYKPQDLLTFDDVYNAIMDKDFIYAKSRNKILKDAAKGHSSKTFPMPPELSKWL